MSKARRASAFSYLGKRLVNLWSQEADSADTKAEEVERDLWDTLKKVAGRLAFSLLEDVLTAYCAMKDPETPAASKAILAGALIYFILPFDVVPDVLPMGFVDDAAILAAALERVGRSTDDRHREEAREIMRRRFPEQAAKIDAAREEAA